MRNFPYQAAARVAASVPLLVAACSESIGPNNVTLEVPPLRIAGTYAETGAYSAEGRGVAAGYRLAVEMLNEQGGIGGRTVQLDLRDDASDPDMAAAIYRQLAADTTIDLLLSPFSSAVTEAVLPVVEAAGRPFVAALAASPELWEERQRQWSVQLLPSVRSFQNVPVRLAAEEGIKTVALVWEDSRAPKSEASGVRHAVQEAGMRLVLDQSYPVGGADHEALATAVMESKAELLIGGNYRNDAIQLTKALDAVGYAPRLVSLSTSAADPAFAEETGELARCVAGYALWLPSIATQGGLASNDVFVQRFRQANGSDPNYLAASSFAAAELLTEAARATTAPSGEIDHGAVRDYLFATSTRTILGPYAVVARGEPDAGSQNALEGLQVQWQDDGEGGLAQRVISPAAFADAQACFNPPDPGPIRVAATISETGPRSHSATSMYRGYRLAVEMLNEQGGIGGRRVELVTADDGSAPHTAAVLYEQFLADTTIDVVVGPYGSPATEAVIPLVETAERPLIAPLASANELWEGQDRQWTVQMSSPATGYLQGAVKLAAEAGARTVALVWENSRFPMSLANGVRDEAARRGLRVVLDRSFRIGRANHERLVAAAKEARADLFVVGAYFDDGVAFARAMEAVEYAPMLSAVSLSPAEPVFAESAGSAAQCVAGNASWVPGIRTRGPIADADVFVQRFREAYGSAPDPRSAAGFGTVELLSMALAESMAEDGEIDDAALRDYLFAADTETVLGPYAVAPLGDGAAGSQQRLESLLVQWQDDGQGGLELRIVHPQGRAQAEACISPRPYRIAGTYPATGILSPDGVNVQKGYALAVEMLNEQGGIAGRPVELILRDDGSSPQAAADIYEEYVADETIDLLLGPYSSPITEAVIPVVEAAERPMIAGAAASNALWAGRDRRWTVQLINPARTFLQGAVEMASQNGIETAALVWEDTRFPVSVAEGVRAAAAEAGIEVVLDRSYPAGRADHEALATAAKEAGAELFIGGGYRNDGIAFTKAVTAAGYTPRLISLVLGPDDPGFPAEVGDLAQCVASQAQWVPSLSNRGFITDTETFVARYGELHGVRPHAHAAVGFGVMELLAEAVSATAGDGGEIDNSALRDYFFATTTETVAGAYAVAPLGDPEAGLQQALTSLQVQWQDDGQGGLVQRVVHPAAAAEAMPCFNSPPIRIGASFPATGYLRNDGSKMRNGYELGVRMLNEQGGIAGRMVELVTRDDGSDPEAAADIYREFVADETIDLVLGPYASSVTEAVMAVTEAAERPLVAPMAASTELWAGRNRRWTVQMLSSADTYLHGSVELAAANGASTAALVWENTRFPQSVAVGVRAALAEHGMQLVLDRSYPPDAADHNALAMAAKEAGADLFIGGGYLSDAVGLTKAAAALKYVPKLMSWNIGPADTQFAELAGDAARCVAGNAPWIPTIRTRGAITDSETFVRRYEEAFGEVEGYHAAGGFGAVELLAQGLRATMTEDGEIDEAALRDFLFATTTETVMGPFGVAPLGDETAGAQQALTGLQVQWQDDGQGGLVQKIIHPASAANAEVCFNVPAIRIGASFPATGYLRNDGSKMRNGYELGVRMLNEQGGIAGRMVELVTRDDGSDPEAAADIYREFVADETIDLVLGPYASSVTEAVMAVTEAAERPLVAPMAASTELWAGRNRQWTVQMLNSAHTYLHGSVKLAAENGASTAALVWEDTRFPESVAVGVRAAAAEHGVQIVLDRSYPPDAADHNALAMAAKEAGADLFIGGGYLNDAVGLTKAAAALEYVPKLMSWNIGPADTQFAELAGDAARCVAGNAPWIPWIRTRGAITDSETFVRRYEEAFGEVEGYHAAGGFGAVELLTQGLRATMTEDGKIDEAALRDFLFTTTTETVMGPFGVAPLGDETAGAQQALTGLQVQWQDDGQGGLVQKIIHPASAANAEACFAR